MYDALALISAVKSVFKDETREKYETFLEVLKDFKA
jgi:histone deacetylase complex regulatory component SIN3